MLAKPANSHHHFFAGHTSAKARWSGRWLRIEPTAAAAAAAAATSHRRRRRAEAATAAAATTTTAACTIRMLS